MSKTLLSIGMAATAAMTLAGGAAAPTVDGTTPDGTPDAEAVVSVEGTSATVTADKVLGTFSFDQTSVSTLEEMSRAAQSSKYLCNSQLREASEGEVVNPLDWRISVGGDVENEFTASLGELSKGGAAQVIMGCVCAANPAGGFSVISADVKGIELAAIAAYASVSEEANTIVFGCADGYSIALPLNYVQYRYSMVVYEANGEALCNSVGGNNQLWLGSTPGSYFARDIVSISYETRETPPPYPFTEEGDEYYGNFPGVGVMAAE